MTKNQKEVKTDNSYLADKVGLRINHLPRRGPVTVLDCFAGTGRIWRAVKRRTKREIRVLGMDKRNLGYHLPGDNLAWLETIDLSRFSVVDLDAYGVPYEQIKLLFERGYKGVVFVTFIQSLWGQMPSGLLIDLGFTDDMIKKAPALCNSRGWEHVLNWLAVRGVDKVWHRSHARKHYFCFVLGGS